MSSSNVSPRMGLNGFHVRSMQPYGPIAKPKTQASLWQHTEPFSACHRSWNDDLLACQTPLCSAGTPCTRIQGASICCRVLVMSAGPHRSYWSSVPAARSSCSVYSMISARRCRMVKGSMIHTGSVTSDVMSIPM